MAKENKAENHFYKNSLLELRYSVSPVVQCGVLFTSRFGEFPLSHSSTIYSLYDI